MSRVSPTLEGFRAALRRPALTLAEITWRWTVGATVFALCAFGLIEYLDTLPVSKGDLLLLRTRHPLLVGQAIEHIIRGSLSRAMLAAMLGAIGLTALWVLAASLGRTATIRALLDYFAERRQTAPSWSLAPSERAGGEPQQAVVREPHDQPRSPFGALVRLNFLRAAVALAVMLGLEGAGLLAGFASPPNHPRPGAAFVIFLPLAGLVCALGWALNWYLSLAGLFAVRDGEDSLGAIAASVALCRERAGPVVAVSTWTALAHLTAFAVAMTAVSLPMSLAPIAPRRLVLAGVLLMLLLYFAVADWLCMARLAGYSCIAEMPDALFRIYPVPPAPVPGPPAAAPSSIDRGELILSDVHG